jgi:hypothetical protein
MLKIVQSVRDFKPLSNKAPQVGLEPTTLRLTEGFQVVAGSCGLLLRHSSFCFYGIFGLAELSKVLLRFAGCCVFKTANKRQLLAA